MLHAVVHTINDIIIISFYNSLDCLLLQLLDCLLLQLPRLLPAHLQEEQAVIIDVVTLPH